MHQPGAHGIRKCQAGKFCLNSRFPFGIQISTLTLFNEFEFAVREYDDLHTSERI